MTPRKFDLETALQFLADEYGEYAYMPDGSKEWQFSATTHYTEPTPTGWTTITEAAVARIKSHRKELIQTLEAVRTQEATTLARLDTIKSLGNIGKDEDDD